MDFEDLPLRRPRADAEKLAIGGIQFYLLTHMALQLSIMLQYARISVLPFERHICYRYSIIAIIIAQFLALTVVHLCLCRPLYPLWTPNIPGAVCLDRRTIGYTVLSFNISMDFLVLIAPLFILRHLSLPWVQKLIISGGLVIWRNVRRHPPTLFGKFYIHNGTGLSKGRQKVLKVLMRYQGQ